MIMGPEQIIPVVANYLEFNPDLTKADTTYVVTTDKTISGTKILATNITLIFAGGKLLGSGTVKANNTFLIAPITKIFDINLNLTGSWIMDRAYPQWFGAKNTANNATDASMDAAPAINKAIQLKRAGEVFLPRGQYVIKDSIRLKYGVILCGEAAWSYQAAENSPNQNDYENQGTVIRPLRSHTLDGDYMVIVNAKREVTADAISPTNAKWTVAWPQLYTAVKNLFFYHVRTEDNSTVENIKGILYAGSITIERCTFRGLVQGATSTHHYTDGRTITDCYFNPDATNSKKYYAFDFFSSGDNVCFKRNQVGVWANHQNALLGALRIDIVFGADISDNILNHNVLISNSTAVHFHSNHMESNNDHELTAKLLIYNSMVHVNSNFFEKSELPNIRITTQDLPNDRNSTSSIVTLDTNQFIYYESDYTIENNAPKFREINQYDIEIDEFSNLQVINTYRCDARRNGSIRKSPNGIMLCKLDGSSCLEFNDYSYLLSKNGMMNLGCHVSLNHALNTTTSVGIVYRDINSNVKWRKKEDSTIATYGYEVYIVWDVKRKIIGGKILYANMGTFTPRRDIESGISVINGIMFTLSGLGLCGFNCIVRLYRQRNNSAIEVCDIPFCGSKIIWDNGVDVGGYPWRDKKTADDMSNALTASGPIQFIGHNVICHAANQPTVGQWKAGDKVFNTASGSTAFWIYTGSTWYAK
jgi:hypothetical protein